jgi:hypothetical protein
MGVFPPNIFEMAEDLSFADTPWFVASVLPGRFIEDEYDSGKDAPPNS